MILCKKSGGAFAWVKFAFAALRGLLKNRCA
jgi:hypothetical protein